METNFKKYIVFWLSQSVSQLGSAMTGFALILWVYTQNHSAMTVSLLSFCSYVPYILVSLFAGAFVDRHSKKKIMLAADSVAALCTAGIFLLLLVGKLEIWHIYVTNAVTGCMNAFQSPAANVAIGKMVPKEKLANVSGMNSFSGNLTAVLTPVLAGALFAWSGLTAVVLIDLCSFFVACFVLLTLIAIPEQSGTGEAPASIFAGCREGIRFLKQNTGILWIVFTMALLNFFSRLTYENILSPMLLSRSGDSSMVLGIVNAAMGLGGIAGGLWVSAGKLSKDNIRMIYGSAAFSFLFGDLLMGLGRNTPVWAVAALAASFPIPFINAGQNVILYRQVPEQMQGRVFAVRNAIQYSTIPLGILLGGFLAEYVFEPFMQGKSAVASFLQKLVGTGAGSGMAVMFLCTGVLGFCFSLLSYRNKKIQAMRGKEADGKA